MSRYDQKPNFRPRFATDTFIEINDPDEQYGS